MKPSSKLAGFVPRRARFVFAAIMMAAIVFGADRIAEKHRGVDRGKATAPMPTLMIGINDASGGVAEPGWPLIISALRLADAKVPITALPANLSLKVTNENNVVVVLPLAMVPRPAEDTAAKSLHWLAAEAATTPLAPGHYRVAAATVPAGWRIESGEFRIVAPNAERTGLLGHLRIKRSVLLGKTDDALAEAERLIGANDKDQAAWIAKGDLLMAKDQPDEAVQAYDRALGLHKKSDREPIAIMARRRTATQRSFEKRGVIAPATPP